MSWLSEVHRGLVRLGYACTLLALVPLWGLLVTSPLGSDLGLRSDWSAPGIIAIIVAFAVVAATGIWASTARESRERSNPEGCSLRRLARGLSLATLPSLVVFVVHAFYFRTPLLEPVTSAVVFATPFLMTGAIAAFALYMGSMLQRTTRCRARTTARLVAGAALLYLGMHSITWLFVTLGARQTVGAVLIWQVIGYTQIAVALAALAGAIWLVFQVSSVFARLIEQVGQRLQGEPGSTSAR